mmetsp:Transcript_87491/g.169507  ORF Transcript_87491/g.169507 Transcript_87491/m.169507 type:complete len:202 (+) Transcript_87491:3-608(+)
MTVDKSTSYDVLPATAEGEMPQRHDCDDDDDDDDDDEDDEVEDPSRLSLSLLVPPPQESGQETTPCRHKFLVMRRSWYADPAFKRLSVVVVVAATAVVVVAAVVVVVEDRPEDVGGVVAAPAPHLHHHHLDFGLCKEPEPDQGDQAEVPRQRAQHFATTVALVASLLTAATTAASGVCLNCCFLRFRLTCVLGGFEGVRGV